MYSLALIIFVVSEKKAFEHFPIGFKVETKLPRNDQWKALYKVYAFFMPIGYPRWPPSQYID
jgi:hypothetical protein